MMTRFDSGQSIPIEGLPDARAVNMLPANHGDEVPHNAWTPPTFAASCSSSLGHDTALVSLSITKGMLLLLRG